MRLIDADELMEHIWRDKLDSRELIAEMINNAPTVKEIPMKIPINIFEQLISQQSKTGKWIEGGYEDMYYVCSECDYKTSEYWHKPSYKYCPNCGARMVSE